MVAQQRRRLKGGETCRAVDSAEIGSIATFLGVDSTHKVGRSLVSRKILVHTNLIDQTLMQPSRDSVSGYSPNIQTEIPKKKNVFSSCTAREQNRRNDNV